MTLWCGLAGQHFHSTLTSHSHSLCLSLVIYHLCLSDLLDRSAVRREEHTREGRERPKHNSGVVSYHYGARKRVHFLLTYGLRL